MRVLGMIRPLLTGVVTLVLVLAVCGSANAATWSWSSPAKIAPSALTGVSCPSVGLCVATDRSGDVVTSRSPTGGASAWTRASIASDGGQLLGVSCPSDALCLAVYEFGGLFVSTDPTAGPVAWKATDNGPASYPTEVVCPSTTLCVAQDSGGIVTSTTPASADAPWTSTPIEGLECGNGKCFAEPVNALACPTDRLCVDVGANGDVVTSTDPIGGAGAWRWQKVDPNGADPALRDISCPSASLCVVGDAAGRRTFASTSPGGQASSWRAIPAGFDTDWLSCPLTTLCLANQADASPFVSSDPLGGASSWRFSDVDHAGTLTAVSCPSATECVAVDDAGNVVTGSPLMAPVRSGRPPSITGNPRVGGTMTAATGAWSGSGTIAYDYRWQRCNPQCVPIAGATQPTYRLTEADQYVRIRVRVTAFDSVGSSQAYSATSREISGPPPSRQVVASALKAVLTPHGTVSRIPALLLLGGYSCTFDAPSPGRLTILWTASIGRHPVVAAAHRTIAARGPINARVALTEVGRRLLAGGARRTIIVKAFFTPTGAHQTMASRTVTLTGGATTA